MSNSDPDDVSLAEVSAALVDEVRQQVPGAWERLVRQFSSLVLSIPREMGLAEDDCDEVYQATWLSVFRHIRSLRIPAALPAWIITTAHRHAWKLIRERRRLIGTELSAVDAIDRPAEDPMPLDETLAWERRQLVHEALEELTPLCRQLLSRLYLDAGAGSYAEVARAMDMPLGSVGPRRIRCLANLARVLERKGFR